MVSIRVLSAEDAAAYRELRLEGLRDSPATFAASYEDEIHLTTDDVAQRIAPTNHSWVMGAFDADRIVGCIGWYRDRGAKVMHRSHIWGMYVVPRYRRQGVARSLVREVLSRAKAVTGVAQIELFVAWGNDSAVRLYEDLGFERVAILPNALILEGRYIDDQLFVLRIADSMPSGGEH